MWKDIKDFKGYYQINENGEIKSLSRTVEGKLGSSRVLNESYLTATDNGKGYMVVALYKNKKRYFRKVHRLVAEAFIPNNDINKTEVNHIDGNKKNNNYQNLEWCTTKENCIHRNKIYDNKNIDNATKAKMIPCAKVDIDTNEILETYNSFKEAGEKNNLNKDYISDCARGKLKKYKGFKWIILK